MLIERAPVLRIERNAVAEGLHAQRDDVIGRLDESIRRGADHGGVKIGVMPAIRHRIAVVGGLLHALDDALQLPCQILAAAAHGEAQRVDLEQFPHLHQLAKLLGGHFEHECSTLRQDFDETFVFQLEKSFAHGRFADPELVCEGDFGKRLAELELPVDNPCPDRVCCLFCESFLAFDWP